MSNATAPDAPVNPNRRPPRRPPVVLTSTPQMVPVRQARRLIMAALFVAFVVHIDDQGGLGKAEFCDVPKRTALAAIRKMAARRLDNHVPLSEVFGTVAVGW